MSIDELVNRIGLIVAVSALIVGSAFLTYVSYSDSMADNFKEHLKSGKKLKCSDKNIIVSLDDGWRIKSAVPARDTIVTKGEVSFELARCNRK